MTKKVLILILILIPTFFNMSVLGYEYRGFSENSVIMQNLLNQNSMTQEDRDSLTSRKLSPTAKCLIEQIRKGNLENVEALLKAKVSPNNSYMTEFPIYVAAKQNKADIVKLLIEYGAKLDRGFYSELYEAVRNKNTELSQLLLDNGAKVNYTDTITNNTILYTALKNNMTDIARQLIKKGAYADRQSVNFIKKHRLSELIDKISN